MHIHEGKLLSTSNQGPNQHPIAHPHNLSASLSSAHLISIPSPPPTDLASCILPLAHPSFPLLPRDGSGRRGGGVEGEMGVMGGTPGNNGRSANSALALMFGGKDRLG